MFVEIIKTILYGIVQGITEWLPISSTGHLLLLEKIMALNVSDTFWSTFLVVIQLGSILAVVVLFFHKLNPFSPKKTSDEKRDTLSLWGKVLIASIPAGVVGLLFDDLIDSYLHGALTIAITLIVYGVLFIVQAHAQKKARYKDFKSLTFRTAFFIGAFQMLSLIPGTSRSGATIFGAILLGCSRYVASEFSFFMAIPAMVGASGYKLLKAGFGFTGTEWTIMVVGFVVAFLVSIVAIKFLLGYIKKHDFRVFGYYRIILGIILIAAILFGWLGVR